MTLDLPLGFRPVRLENEIATVVGLAASIWREYYPALIGIEQVNYMLQRFQSAAAIDSQLKSEFFYYYTIDCGTTQAGYLAFRVENNEIFIGKFYLSASFRGSGYGRKALRFIEERALEIGAKRLRLTVNKRNRRAIVFYERNGFERSEAISTEIGAGYVMDDYVYRKEL